MLSLRSLVGLIFASLTVVACDVVGQDLDTGPVGTTAALAADADGPAVRPAACLPVEAFGSDMDLIDACMDCVAGAVCTGAQVDAGCCASPPASSGSVSPSPIPSDIGSGAAEGALTWPQAAPLPLGPGSSG